MKFIAKSVHYVCLCIVQVAKIVLFQLRNYRVVGYTYLHKSILSTLLTMYTRYGEKEYKRLGVVCYGRGLLTWTTKRFTFASVSFIVTSS